MIVIPGAFRSYRCSRTLEGVLLASHAQMALYNPPFGYHTVTDTYTMIGRFCFKSI